MSNKIKVTDLKNDYYVYGNKGNVWNDTSHIYKSGTGNLCGTPSLSSNWSQIENVSHVGCPKCIELYNQNN